MAKKLKVGDPDDSKTDVGPMVSMAAADRVQAMIADVGIKTKYRVIDVATITDEAYFKYNYDIWFTNFGASQFIEDNWKYFKCGWTYENGGFNASAMRSARCTTSCGALISSQKMTNSSPETRASVSLSRTRCLRRPATASSNASRFRPERTPTAATTTEILRALHADPRASRAQLARVVGIARRRSPSGWSGSSVPG